MQKKLKLNELNDLSQIKGGGPKEHIFGADSSIYFLPNSQGSGQNPPPMPVDPPPGD